MSSIFRTNDPTQFDDVDGIIIDESAPPANVQGAPANIGILVAQFQRGPSTLEEPGSIGDLFEQYGKSSYGGNLALKNKKFGRLKIIRVVAADSVVAKEEFDSSSVDRIRFTAKQGNGVYGNSIQVKIEAGTTSGKKYTIHDASVNAVLPDEVYDNIAIASVTSSTFGASRLVTATVLSSAAEPANTSGFVNLAGGSDGTVGDTDYQTAIAVAEVERAGNVLFLDAYNSTRNNYLKLHAALTTDKMVICAGAEGDSVSDTKTAVASLRDTDGRIMYSYPWVETSIDGVNVFVSPAPFLASVITQTAPNIDPAFTENAKFLQGITRLKLQLKRADYIQLKDAGVCSFELDEDIGVVVKSGVTTQIINSSKVTILRRRMADFLTDSLARFLKNYQGAVNSVENRRDVKGGVIAFDEGLIRDKILPADSEVKTGKARLIDTESLNTDASVAAGFFKMIYKRRIYSSMRFIVLQAEIGESVVVTEGEA